LETEVLGGCQKSVFRSSVGVQKPFARTIWRVFRSLLLTGQSVHVYSTCLTPLKLRAGGVEQCDVAVDHFRVRVVLLHSLPPR
jgi:hypothetical protein